MSFGPLATTIASLHVLSIMEFYVYSLDLGIGYGLHPFDIVHLDGCDGFYEETLSPEMSGTELHIFCQMKSLKKCHSTSALMSKADLKIVKVELEECSSTHGISMVTEIVSLSEYIKIPVLLNDYPQAPIMEYILRSLQGIPAFNRKVEFCWHESVGLFNSVFGFEFDNRFRVVAFRGNDSPSYVLDF
ncbi:hypothetical protein [Cerasicoccus fimbriatus]|uniref:hypothetical protein n=1 Tax=Cerasicoccus fimbriatus TaxID=3014554 RepID=UPI0022B361C6|nr:hypothetical protein [Cerasicoccus sp. TK19100]